jgi:hypothetical protein
MPERGSSLVGVYHRQVIHAINHCELDVVSSAWCRELGVVLGELNLETLQKERAK